MIKKKKKNIINIQGWRTKQKIIVIESDDWGSIRMPSKKIYKVYQELGYDLSKSPYCRFDTLANSNDINSLFEVLRRFKDSKGNHPKMTFNTVMVNPNFEKIKENEFNKYFYESFTHTIKKYYPNENVFELWKQGISEGLIYPQFHGREHVNVPIWLDELKSGNPSLKTAFNLGFWGIPRDIYGKKFNIQAAYQSAQEEHLEFYRNNILEGTKIFENTFGFKAETFIANNYTFPAELSKTLFFVGIKGIQSMKYHKIPRKDGSLILKKVYTGKKNNFNQIYTVRNCMFEPSQMPRNFDSIGNCLKGIANSFFWGKPAIITSHRLNYIGAIDEDNRRLNLKLLDRLIQKILAKWPDVEFISSNELINIINKYYEI